MVRVLSFACCLSGLIGAMGGCALRGNVEVLETRLRQQEELLTDMERQLAATRSELQVAKSEGAGLRAAAHERGEETLAVEQAEVLYRAESAKFNPLLTSGLDADGKPGDEGLSALLMPLDKDGELIKLAGGVELELLDLSLPREKQRIGNWTFTAEEAGTHWHRGMLAAGYLFQLPWQDVPTSNNLLLHGRLLVPDGRQFDATQALTVKSSQAEANPQLSRRQRPKRAPTETVEQASHDERRQIRQTTHWAREPEKDAPADTAPHDEATDTEPVDAPHPDESPSRANRAVEASDRYRDWEIPQRR